MANQYITNCLKYKLIILLVIVSVILFYQFNKKDEIEHYWGITPYNYHWNIFKCLDGDCIRDESRKCYRWCDNWEEEGGSDNCRYKCMDYADIMYDQLKFNNYTFNRVLPRFEEWSLLRNTDYV